MKLHKHKNGDITLDGEGMKVKLSNYETADTWLNVSGFIKEGEITVANFVFEYEV